MPTTNGAPERSTEPGGRPPAPGGLAAVQAFVNTNDREGGQDALASAERFRIWLGEHAGIARPHVSDTEFERAIGMREALRSLAIRNAGGSSDAGALATINAEAKRTGLTISFVADALRPRSAAVGVDGFLAGLLAAVAESMIDGSWARLKACRRDACQWLFFDRSPNASAAWCDMRICGSREKAKSYYRRRRRTTRAGSRSAALTAGHLSLHDPEGL